MPNPAEQIADELLVIDAQSGRRDAFDALVSRWQKRLWWHALNLTGRTEAAWDIAQESWLHIVKGLTRLHVRRVEQATNSSGRPRSSPGSRILTTTCCLMMPAAFRRAYVRVAATCPALL